MIFLIFLSCLLSMNDTQALFRSKKPAAKSAAQSRQAKIEQAYQQRRAQAPAGPGVLASLKVEEEPTSSSSYLTGTDDDAIDQAFTNLIANYTYDSLTNSLSKPFESDSYTIHWERSSINTTLEALQAYVNEATTLASNIKKQSNGATKLHDYLNQEWRSDGFQTSVGKIKSFIDTAKTISSASQSKITSLQSSLTALETTLGIEIEAA
jgi:hypothetical protein